MKQKRHSVGDVLVCTPGGRLGTVAEPNKRTGKLIWRSKELTDEAVCSSQMRVEIDSLARIFHKFVACAVLRDGPSLGKSGGNHKSALHQDKDQSHDRV